ncbi:uncharacterized protein F4812DRAFT_147020 [Daldinia caldariorum]|uniref:uncharacterized protein n=1 Tax=Daldinia caldariorum TaxID=326644 RepID=UPI0020087231|nr:uncharacterized protein F4812DRAFT_147020 [Daldinia caldariorum]KAI1464977.1 hypothetical protein F4812DRAFT_147020 [Daldinia caldariorum]
MFTSEPHTTTPTPTTSTSTSTTSPATTTTPKPPRVLACVLCQQRKVKCDKVFPCANCVRSRAPCVRATLAPPRRRGSSRRFPKRELVDRLSHYENLLRENGIPFESVLGGGDGGGGSSSKTGAGSGDGSGDRRTPQDAARDEVGDKPELAFRPKDIWRAISEKTSDSEDSDIDRESDDDDGGSWSFKKDSLHQPMITKVWDRIYESEDNSHLLFAAPQTGRALSTLHPEHIHIFRLWQVYLDNVDPLLKVTHTPTLQARIIDATSHITNIDPAMEALIFSIYCVSVFSLTNDECHAFFMESRDNLLLRYQLGCRQALQNCRFLQNTDRDCLTALYLYLISVRPKVDPRSLSSMLSIAVRIARRMGIHDEYTCAKFTALEAEMRRRLWWSLIIFDNRISELCDYKTASLAPTWDCRIPVNVYDSEIRLEMKIPLAIHEKPTEAIFAVVRSELADFVRHSSFHIMFTNPSLSTIAKSTRQGSASEGDELDALERSIEGKYLAFCDLDNPLHFMTVWSARGYLAKIRILDYYSRHLTSATQPTDTERNALISSAINMLECDTKLMDSPVVKGYRWLITYHFPLPAYIHLLQGLKKRPVDDKTEQAWDAMSDNYRVRFMNSEVNEAFFHVFSRIVLKAWEAREALSRQEGGSLVPPLIVSDVRDRILNTKLNNPQDSQVVGLSNTDLSQMSGSMGFSSGYGPSYSMREQESSTNSGFWANPSTTSQGPMEAMNFDDIGWTGLGWTI